MKKIKEVKNDLSEIRYYFSRLKVFTEYNQIVGENEVKIKINLYNDIVRKASPRLYDIYIGLYIKCFTQETLSSEMGYTREYIRLLNKRLINFFVENM